jgi:hypothetical protein
VSIVTCSLPLLCSGFQRRTFRSLSVPELSPCLSYQLLTAAAHNDWTAAVLCLLSHQSTSSLHSTNSLTAWISSLSCTDRTIHRPSLLFSFALGTCLFAKPLLSNGFCIFAYVAVVTQQRVYTPQYVTSGSLQDVLTSLKFQPWIFENKLYNQTKPAFTCNKYIISFDVHLSYRFSTIEVQYKEVYWIVVNKKHDTKRELLFCDIHPKHKDLEIVWNLVK